MRLLFALIVCFLVGGAHAGPAQLPAACKALIAGSFPGWKPFAPSAEVTAWAKTKNINPAVTAGDFDANGKIDWATLGTNGKKEKVVLCLSLANRRTLVTIDDGGCTDMVYTIRARTRVPNYDTGNAEVLRRDSVATDCFEKSGRVFSYEGGRFRVFYHSD